MSGSTATQRCQRRSRSSPTAATRDRVGTLSPQSNDRIRVCLEIEPPRRVAFVPAVHRECDEVGAVVDVADDDAAFLSGLPSDRREVERTPLALARRRPEQTAPAEPVERAMPTPECVHEPGRRHSRRSIRRCLRGHIVVRHGEPPFLSLQHPDCATPDARATRGEGPAAPTVSDCVTLGPSATGVESAFFRRESMPVPVRRARVVPQCEEVHRVDVHHLSRTTRIPR